MVEVDDRVARGRPGERRLGDRPAGEGVEQRRFADAGAAHEHDDEQRPVHVERLGLAAQVVGEAFEFGPLEHGERELPPAVEPAAKAPLQPAEERRERPQKRLRRLVGR